MGGGGTKNRIIGNPPNLTGTRMLVLYADVVLGVGAR